MLSYDGIQDVFTAILVIIIVSVIVALAWLSTNVREQPLVATAVVVFQSERTGENHTESSNEQSQRETQGGSAREGEASAVGLANIVKESENSSVNGEPDMEVPERTDGNSSKGRNDMPESESTEVQNEIKPTPMTSMEADIEPTTNSPVSCTESAAVEGQGSETKSPESDVTGQLGSSSTPSQVNRDEQKDSAPEMEVRKRRLQQFMSMGENSSSKGTENHSESPSPLTRDEDSYLHTTNDKGTGHKDDTVLKDSFCNSRIVVENCTSSDKSEQSSTLDSEGEEDTRPPGSIRIRLKFLDETQRFVFAQLTEQVGSFKRQHFSIEMDANRRIRLIFNGQLLSQDNSTLAQYGLFDNCVVHCHVSQPQQTSRNANQNESVAHEEEDAYMSGLLAPLLYFVMGMMWYLRYEYGHLFNTMSTVILLFLTALLLFSTYLLYITQNVPESRSTTQVSAHSETETQSAL